MLNVLCGPSVGGTRCLHGIKMFCSPNVGGGGQLDCARFGNVSFCSGGR